MAAQGRGKGSGLKKIGILCILLSLIIPAVYIFVILDNPDSFDSWVDDEPDQGDTITIAGKIGSKEKSTVNNVTIYEYEFKGSDVEILSADNIGDKDEFVILVIAKDRSDYVVDAQFSIFFLLIPPAFLLLIGVIALMIGIMRSRKDKRMMMGQQPYPAAPGQYPTHYPPQQAYPGQPPQAPPTPITAVEEPIVVAEVLDDSVEVVVATPVEVVSTAPAPPAPAVMAVPAPGGAPMPPPPPPPPPAEHVCPTCGDETKHVAQYDRWYCYKCGKYEPADGKKVDEGPKTEKLKCPKCSYLFSFLAKEGPQEIKCPKCGTSGVIRK